MAPYDSLRSDGAHLEACNMKKYYCHKCRRGVAPESKRCPGCKKILWEFIAKQCKSGDSDLRTTGKIYGDLYRHGAQKDDKGERKKDSRS